MQSVFEEYGTAILYMTGAVAILLLVNSVGRNIMSGLIMSFAGYYF